MAVISVTVKDYSNTNAAVLNYLPENKQDKKIR